MLYIVLDYHLRVGYLIYFKFTCVSSIVYQCYILNSIKETNWLINKGLYVLLFDVFKHLGKINKKLLSHLTDFGL